MGERVFPEEVFEGKYSLRQAVEPISSIVADTEIIGRGGGLRTILLNQNTVIFLSLRH